MPNPGLSPEIMQAMARRQQGGPPTPQLNQMSPGSAGAPAMPQPMAQSQMTKASAPQGAPAQPKWQPQNQDDMIVAALIEKTKNNDKLRKEQSQMAQPAPSTPPQGGGGGYPGDKLLKGGGGFSLSPGYSQPMPVNQMQSDYQGGMGRDYSGLGNYGKSGGF